MDDFQQTPQPVNHQPGAVIQPSGASAGSTPPDPVVMPIEPAQPTPQVFPVNANPVQMPQPTSTPDTGLVGVMPSTTPPGRKFGLPVPKPKGKILVALIAIAVAIIGVATYAFAFYLPNQPSKIWSSALTNTGKGYDKLSDYAVNLSSEKNKGVKVDGSFKTTGFLTADGSFQGSNDGANGEFKGSLSAAGIKINLDARLIQSGSGTPDVYFKVDGLQDLGTLLGGADSPYATAINGLNGKWYFVDHTLFDQFTGSSSSGLQVTSADVSSILKAVGDASKQNVFTSDPKKMAFTVNQNVGKEKQDGRNVYHFKVAINKQNLKNYVTALCNNLGNSNLKKFLGGDSQSTKSTLGCDTATGSVDKFSATRTADVWVDTHTKLIHKIRFTNPSQKSSYFEVGQDYQGGDKFPFTINTQDKSSYSTSTGNVTLTLDMKTNQLAVSGKFKDSGSDGTNNFDSSFSLKVSPNNNPVKVEKPADARTLIQLLNDAGLNDFFAL